MGCSQDLAAEILRFPILKFLRLTAKEINTLPLPDLVQYNIHRKMGEQPARGVLYALPERFTLDQQVCSE